MTLATALAVIAPPAFAGTYEQSQHKYPATLQEKATSPTVFKFEGVTVSCNRAAFSGTLPGATAKVSVVPKYEECNASESEIKGSTSVKVAHCEFQTIIGGLQETIKEGTKEAGSESKVFPGGASIENEKGGTCGIAFETKVGSITCIITAGAQAPRFIKKEVSKHKWFPFEWENTSEGAATAVVFVSKGCVVIKDGTHEGGALAENTISGPNFEIN
jgi:hypothetical protein